jgi:hypothetical protein
MFKFATGMAMVGVSLLMLYGPSASVPEPLQRSPDTNIWPAMMGPDLGGRSATQSVPALPPNRVVLSAHPAATPSDDAEYRAEQRACEALVRDARNHCLEYARLRYGRS